MIFNRDGGCIGYQQEGKKCLEGYKSIGINPQAVNKDCFVILDRDRGFIGAQ